jgi:L-Ala-D/L-Glu epimerase
VINIKLDKCGGLTEALRMVDEARRVGLGTMVGSMFGTSLAAAAGFVVGQLCEIVDLDGPTILVKDREPAVRYEDGRISCPDGLWGAYASS